MGNLGGAFAQAPPPPREGDAQMSKHSGQTRDAPDGCPIDHKNMSEEQLAGLMAQFRKQPSDAHEVDSATRQRSGGRGEEKCPVDHKNLSKEELAGLMATHRDRPASPEQGPLLASENRSDKSGEKAYNVYGQEIDPANMMPAVPNQLPSPGQQVRLSTDRASSSIPKSGDAEGTTWAYPSPQMFFNALKRKGKADDVHETDIDSVVAIHNRMNERTWREVHDWERRFHCDECSNPKLRQFMGRPHELSPAARFRSTFRGYPRPFDRHDWVVDRCGLRDVRYIIDYYYREDADTGEPMSFTSGRPWTPREPSSIACGTAWALLGIQSLDLQGPAKFMQDKWTARGLPLMGRQLSSRKTWCSRQTLL
jgi:hypothetical protein